MPRKAKGASSVEHDWKKQAETLLTKARLLPAGEKRDALIRMADALDAACRMSDWLKPSKIPAGAS